LEIGEKATGSASIGVYSTRSQSSGESLNRGLKNLTEYGVDQREALIVGAAALSL
jgi:hypothetical protein